MLKKKKSDKVDFEKLNDSIDLLNKILRILFFVLIIIGIFVINYILKQWKIFSIIGTIFRVLVPFFLGFFIAWLFNPLVTKLSSKMKRGYATIIVYLGFLLILAVFIFYCIPTMISQLNEFVKVIPKLQKAASGLIDNIYDAISPIINMDIHTLKKQVYDLIMSFGSEITSDLPSKLISIASLIVSGFGTFLIGLVIGVYMLIDFNGISKHVLSLFPQKWQKDIKELISIVDRTSISFIHGTFMISLILTLFTYVAFLLLGIKAPLLFALFCGITNIIPYIGPYLGGIPVVLVGFTQGTTTGILVIVAVVAAQALDEYILRPLLLGRGLNLHPVTTIIALLIFGHFFGMIGMLFAMPVVAIFKLIYGYYDDKYDFFNRKITEENNT